MGFSFNNRTVTFRSANEKARVPLKELHACLICQPNIWLISGHTRSWAARKSVCSFDLPKLGTPIHGAYMNSCVASNYSVFATRVFFDSLLFLMNETMEVCMVTERFSGCNGTRFSTRYFNECGTKRANVKRYKKCLNVEKFFSWLFCLGLIWTEQGNSGSERKTKSI